MPNTGERRKICKPVVGDHVGPGLGFCQILQANDRHFGQTKPLCSLKRAVPGQNAIGLVDQNGGVEPKLFDALSNRLNLGPPVFARIDAVGFQI
jgi:hypothetical protein